MTRNLFLRNPHTQRFLISPGLTNYSSRSLNTGSHDPATPFQSVASRTPLRSFSWQPWNLNHPSSSMRLPRPTFGTDLGETWRLERRTNPPSALICITWPITGLKPGEAVFRDPVARCDITASRHQLTAQLPTSFGEDD